MDGALIANGVSDGMHLFEYIPGNSKRGSVRVVYLSIDADGVNEQLLDFGSFDVSPGSYRFAVPRPALETGGQPRPYALFAYITESESIFNYPFSATLDFSLQAEAQTAWSVEPTTEQFPIIRGIVGQYFADGSRKRAKRQSVAEDLNSLLKRNLDSYFMNAEFLTQVIASVDGTFDQTSRKREANDDAGSGCWGCMLSVYIALAASGVMVVLVSALRRYRGEGYAQPPRYLTVWLDGMARRISDFVTDRSVTEIASVLTQLLTQQTVGVAGVTTILGEVTRHVCTKLLGYKDCY